MPSTMQGRRGRRWTWLVLPWRAQDQGGQWLMLVLLALTLGGAVLSIPLAGPDWPVRSGLLTSVAVLVIWLYLMPGCLRLTLCARDLRLPAVNMQLRAVLALYAVLSCAVPALLFTLAGGPGLTVGIALFFTAAAAFLMALLPSHACFAICMAPAMIHLLPATRPAWLPQPGDAAFLPALALAGTALACLAIMRWARISAHGMPHSRWRRPLISNLSVTGFRDEYPASCAHADETRHIRQLPDWLQPEVDIRVTGPGHPRRSLRVALGAAWLPLTRRSHGRQILYGILVMACCLAFLVLITHGDADGRHSLWHATLALAGWTLLALGCLTSLSPLLSLHRRWSRSHAELSLLALLPHLDHPTRIKSTLFEVCLRQPLIRWLAWVALAWTVMCWRHGGVTSGITLVMAFVAVMGALLIVALLLAVLGHHHITRAGMVVLTVYLFLLSFLSGGYALAVLVGSLVFSAFGVMALALCWGLLLIPLCRFIVDGHRRWRQLPHPFLMRGGLT